MYTLSPSRSSLATVSGKVNVPPSPDSRRISVGRTRGQRLAKPKSPILRVPAGEMRMLAGLMSKWMTPFEWMWCRPCSRSVEDQAPEEGVLTSESSRTIFHTLASSRRSTTLPYSSKKKAKEPRHSSVWMNSCLFCSHASSNLMTCGDGRFERCRRMSTSSKWRSLHCQYDCRANQLDGTLTYREHRQTRRELS